MMAFVTAAALMLGLALLFVLPGLLRRVPVSAGAALSVSDALNLEVLRDQRRELDADLRSGTLDEANHQSSRRELEQRVAHEVQAHQPVASAAPAQPLAAAVVGTAVLGLAVLLYAAVGTPLALDPARRVAAVPAPANEPTPVDGGNAAAVGPAQIEAMVNRLAERLKANPDDPKGWRMLATSYETLRRFDLAAQAYKNLLEVTPETPELLADYAVALGMSQDQTLSGEPEALIRRALAIDPNNVQALALAGSAAYERHDYAQAVAPWKHLLSRVPAESDMARSIASNIAKAESLSRQSSTAGTGGR